MGMKWRTYLFVGAVVLLSSPAAQGQARSSVAQTPVPQVRLAPCTPIPSVEGRDNFSAYCAVCHGADARGGGPAAPAMKAPVPDLTTLAMRNGGKFDLPAVEYIVRGTGKIATPAHGTTDMPIWGQVFCSTDRAVGALRMTNLVKYLESIQRGK